MKNIFAFLLLFFSLTCFGQGQKKAAIDSGSYLWVGKQRLGFYVEPLSEVVMMQNTFYNHLGLAAGVVFNDRIAIGPYANFKIDDFPFVMIFPNTFNLDIIHGGLQLAYMQPINQRIAIVATPRIGKGEAIATNTGNNERMATTNFNLYQFTLGVDYQMIRFAKIHAGIGYRQLTNVDIPQLKSEDLSGLTFQVSLKLGLFKRIMRQKEDQDEV